MDECPRHECTVIRKHRLVEQRVGPFFPVPPCALVPCQLAWHDEHVLDLVVEAGKQLRQPRVGVALEFVLVVALDKLRHTVYEIPFQVQQLVVDRRVVVRRTAVRQLDSRLAFAELACHALLVCEHRFDAQLRMVFDLRGEFPQLAGQIAEPFELGEVASRHHVCFWLRLEPTFRTDVVRDPGDVVFRAFADRCDTSLVANGPWRIPVFTSYVGPRVVTQPLRSPADAFSRRFSGAQTCVGAEVFASGYG